jgi:lysyl-tRNA synthetase class 1
MAKKEAKIWLDGYAPEDFIFKVQPKLPKEAQKLSLKQREYLTEVAVLMKKSWKDEKQLENGLYEVARKLNFPSTETFKAIYLIFLGKPHGPKVAPFLLAQEKKFLVRRFEEAIT